MNDICRNALLSSGNLAARGRSNKIMERLKPQRHFDSSNNQQWRPVEREELEKSPPWTRKVKTSDGVRENDVRTNTIFRNMYIVLFSCQLSINLQSFTRAKLQLYKVQLYYCGGYVISCHPFWNIRKSFWHPTIAPSECVQGSTEERALGCVKRAPATRGITQPRATL